MDENQKENPKIIIAHGLAEFFKDEPYKIALWLLCDNPFFGNVSPAQLIAIRGDAGLKKVANFIISSREGEGL